MKIWIALQILIAIGLVWQLAKALRNRRHLVKPPEGVSDSPKGPTISICLAVRDEEPNLIPLLKEISIQDFALYELLIYDDGSSDQTAELATQYIKRFGKLRLIGPPEEGPAPRGRNAALDYLARHAKYECLLFLDSRCELRRESLSQFKTLWKEAGTDALLLYGHNVPQSPVEKIFGPFREHRLITCSALAGLERRGPDVAIEGGVLAVSRDAFIEIGGFGDNPNDSDAEIELIWRLKSSGKTARMADARAMLSTCRPARYGELFQTDRRSLWRFCAPGQRWLDFCIGTLALHAVPMAAALGCLLNGAFGFWQFWSAAMLVALGWAGRAVARREFGSSRLSLALHPLLVLHETLLALDLLFCAVLKQKPRWKGRAWG